MMMSATLKILAWWILITTVVSFLIVANVLKLDTYVFQNYKVLFLFVSRLLLQKVNLGDHLQITSHNFEDFQNSLLSSVITLCLTIDVI